jgi:hypothetical protein
MNLFQKDKVSLIAAPMEVSVEIILCRYLCHNLCLCLQHEGSFCRYLYVYVVASTIHYYYGRSVTLSPLR